MPYDDDVDNTMNLKLQHGQSGVDRVNEREETASFVPGVFFHFEEYCIQLASRYARSYITKIVYFNAKTRIA